MCLSKLEISDNQRQALIKENLTYYWKVIIGNDIFIYQMKPTFNISTTHQLKFAQQN